jgi:hypothetical protein
LLERTDAPFLPKRALKDRLWPLHDSESLRDQRFRGKMRQAKIETGSLGTKKKPQ